MSALRCDAAALGASTGIEEPKTRRRVLTVEVKGANLLAMGKRVTIWLLATLMLALSASAEDAVHSLEAALKGKPRALRSYSADKVARYEWQDGKLVAGPVRTHTLAVFLTQSIKLKDGSILLKGERSSLVQNSKKNRLELSGKNPMLIEVDLRGEKPEVVLPKLEEMMFFPDPNAAVDGLPEQVAVQIPLDSSTGGKPNCECFMIFERNHWIRLVRKDPKFTPAKVTHSVDPQFSEEAASGSVSGLVFTIFYVSETGQVGDIWVANSIGYGLDEEAVKSVAQYVFAPAQYDGLPVGTEVTVEVNFAVP